MLKQSSFHSSHRTVSQALLLVAALLFQSLATPLRGVVFAETVPEKKIASNSTTAAQPKLPDPKVFPQPVQQQQPNAPNATVITATLDDNVAAATKVAPGGTINYTAVIKNTGTAGTDDATSVNYTHILDSNTTLVAGSVHASPIAINNSYTTAVGNTLLEVSNSPSSTAPKVTAAGTLFDNDTIATAPDTFVLQSFQTPSANGGTVAVNANGSFTYLPAAGFTGTDTFTYTIRNSADATLQDTATVTITVNTPRVWYVDNSGANGDGRSTSPFNTLAGAAAVDGIGDIIYIFTGGANYTGGITLLNNEQVIGNGVALVVNTITLRAAGARPTVVNGAGNGMTLASANTLRGFNFGNCTGGFAFQGGAVGALTVNNMLISTNGGAMDITAALSSVSIVLDSTTSSGGAQSVRLVTVNGTVTLGSGALSGATGNGLDVSGGAATITFSGTISNSGAKQVNIANMTAGGSVALSGGISGTGTGINLATNTGATISFTGALALSTGANTAFSATGGGTVTSTNANSTLATTTGTALNINSTTIGGGGLTFLSINASTASANAGIVLNSSGAGALNVTGTSTTAGTGGTIANRTGNGVDLRTANNISLKNMNLTNNAQTNGDNTTNNCGVTSSSGGNVNCTASLYLGTVNTITLDNVNINGSNQDGLNGLNVIDLKILNSTVQGAGNEAGECGVFIQNLTGNNCAITNSTFQNNNVQGFAFINWTTGALGTAGSPFNISNSTFIGRGNTSLNGDGVLGRARGTTTAVVNVTNSHFTKEYSYGVFLDAADTGNATYSVTGCDFGAGGAANYNNSGIATGISSAASVNYTFSNNTITGIAFGTPGNGVGIVVTTGTTTPGASIIGTISGNTIGETGVSGSGGFGNAAAMQLLANGGGPMVYKASVTGNHIFNPTALGIQYIGGTTTGAVTGTLHITGNDIHTDNVPAGSPFGQAIAVAAAASGAGGAVSTLCADISGNTMTGTWDGVNTDRIRVTTLRGSIYTVGGMPGSGAQTVAAVTAFVGSQNGAAPPLTSGSNTASGGGTFNANSGAACPLLLAEGGVMAVLKAPSLFSSFVNSVLDPSGAPAQLGVPSSSNLATVSLDQQQLDSVVNEAIARWRTTGLTRNQMATLRRIKFEVADLGDTYLGQAGDRILIDRNAGGKGWYTGFDSTSDLVFSHSAATTRRYTDPTSAPAGHMDLLTSIEHEIGHKLGLDDVYSASDRDNLMYGFLTVGERRLAAPSQARHSSNKSSAHILQPSAVASVLRPVAPASAERATQVTRYAPPTTPVKRVSIQPAIDRSRDVRLSHHAVQKRRAATNSPDAPLVTVSVALGTLPALPAGKVVTIKYAVTVNSPPLVRQISAQGTVTFNGNPGGSVNTTDFSPPNGPFTVTLIDTLMTWNGVTSTDWNTATNWTPPAGGTQYVPGGSNPAVNDVTIPAGVLPNEPTIGAANPDITIFSLNIAVGRTLTIDPARTLTIGAPAAGVGGDLTLNGVITGGKLNLGTGTHIITVGTGSLSSTNLMTVLSGSTVTLNNNLQAGALAVNASGGSMNITNRTLSLNGAGAALTIPGGATFTTTGSTVVLNGGVAQTIAGIAYNNLTINNSIGTHVTGVTLQGNASVSGVLTLTSSDLATTGAFTLTMPLAATSGPASGATDVVGNVKRTGFVSGGAALSFGNPFNTIKINSGAAPADINILLAKNAPATYAAAVSRSYTITPSVAPGPATLRLHYRQAELNGNVEAPPINFNLRKGPTWANAVIPTARNVGVPEDNWLENNNVTSFSEWTMATLAPTASDGVINGRITRADGTPVEGAVINLSGGQSRKTITDADGNYHFDKVDAGGFYTVTPSRANYSFNPFNRSFSMVGNQTEAGFNGTMLGDNLNPVDTPEYFVRQQYVDILGREPDEDGFNYWSNHILACGGDVDCTRAERTGVAAAFFIENEFKQSGAFIYNLYKGALGRRPVYAEYSADRRQVVGGATLEAQKQAFAEAFVARAEFATRYASNTDAASFVDALLANVQQTSGVDLSGQRDSLIESYNTGTSQADSRTLVLRAVTESAAVRDANYNGAFVAVEYFGYLHRGPDQEGYDFWLNVLNTGDPGNYRGMVCSFITSREYQRRFSAVVSHSNSECGSQ